MNPWLEAEHVATSARALVIRVAEADAPAPGVPQGGQSIAVLELHAGGDEPLLRRKRKYHIFPSIRRPHV